MKCIICRNDETVQGKTTVTFERNGMTLVIKNVPAWICPNCGEAYVDEEISDELLKSAETAECEGVEVEIRNFQAA